MESFHIFFSHWVNLLLVLVYTNSRPKITPSSAVIKIWDLLTLRYHLILAVRKILRFTHRWVRFECHDDSGCKDSPQRSTNYELFPIPYKNPLNNRGFLSKTPSACCLLYLGHSCATKQKTWQGKQPTKVVGWLTTGPRSFAPLEFALLALPRSSPRIAPEAPGKLGMSNSRTALMCVT